MDYLFYILAGDGEAPSFLNALEPIQLNDGDKTVLTVTFTGKPIPNVQWFHNDSLLVPSVDVNIITEATESRLIIEDTMPEDAGLYKVVLTNPHGDAVSAASVAVLEEEIVEPDMVGLIATQTNEVILEEEVPSEEEGVQPAMPVTEITVDDQDVVSTEVKQQQVVTETEDVQQRSVQSLQEEQVSTSVRHDTEVVSERTKVEMKTTVTKTTLEGGVISEETTETRVEKFVEPTTTSATIDTQTTDAEITSPLLVEEETLAEVDLSQKVEATSVVPVQVDLDISSDTKETQISQTKEDIQEQPLSEIIEEQPAHITTADSENIQVETSTSKLGEQDLLSATESIEQGQILTVESASKVDLTSAIPTTEDIDSSVTDTVSQISQAPEIIAKDQQLVVQEDVKPITSLTQSSDTVKIDQQKVQEDQHPSALTTSIVEEEFTSSDTFDQSVVDKVVPEDTEISVSQSQVGDEPSHVSVAIHEQEMVSTEVSSTIKTDTSVSADTDISSDQTEISTTVQRVDHVSQHKEHEEVTEVQSEQSQTISSADVVVSSETTGTALQPSQTIESTVEDREDSVEGTVEPVQPLSQEQDVVTISQEKPTDSLQVAEAPMSIAEKHLQISETVTKQAVDSATSDAIDLALSSGKVEDTTPQSTDIISQEEDMTVAQPSTAVEMATAPSEESEILYEQDVPSDVKTSQVSAVVAEEQLKTTDGVNEQPVEAVQPQQADIPTLTSTVTDKPAQAAATEKIKEDLSLAQPSATIEVHSVEESEADIKTSKPESSAVTQQVSTITQDEQQVETSQLEPKETISIDSSEIIIDSTEKDSSITPSQTGKETEEIEQFLVEDSKKPVTQVTKSPEEVSIDQSSPAASVTPNEVSLVVSEEPMQTSDTVSKTSVELGAPAEIEVSTSGSQAEEKPLQGAFVAEDEQNMVTSKTISETQLVQPQQSETSVQSSTSESTLEPEHVSVVIQEQSVEKTSSFKSEDTQMVSSKAVSIDSTPADTEIQMSSEVEIVSEEERLSVADEVVRDEPISEKPENVVVDEDKPTQDREVTEASIEVIQKEVSVSVKLSETAPESSISEQVEVNKSSTSMEIKPTSVKPDEITTEQEDIKPITSEDVARPISSDEVVSPTSQASLEQLPTSTSDTFVEDQMQTIDSEVVKTKIDEQQPVDVRQETDTTESEQKLTVTDSKVSEVPTDDTAPLVKPTIASVVSKEADVATDEHTKSVVTAKTSTSEELVPELSTKPIESLPETTSQTELLDVAKEPTVSDKLPAAVSTDEKIVSVSKTEEVQRVTKVQTTQKDVKIETEKLVRDSTPATIAPSVETSELFDTQQLAEPSLDSTIPEDVDVSSAQASVITIKHISEVLDFDMRQDMELSVEFAAVPSATVTWFKDDEEIEETERLR